ncbi:MAG TPA: S8 family serine peptidase [Actinomycetota bacterium]|nr:S8 family serine peptidase [Actinomycetota bacterium]
MQTLARGGTAARPALALIPALLMVLGLLAGPGKAAATPGYAQRYIVVLRLTADPGATAAEHAQRHGASVSHVYRSALNGYAATMSARAAGRVAADPRVLLVEADQQVQAFAQSLPTGVDRISEPNSAGATTSHLDIDGNDDWRVDVDVAVLDTGIDVDHPDLNVVGGVNCAKGGPFNNSCEEGNYDDGNGHGTHVAGTIAALDNDAAVVGVAPGARLWAVRVLDNNGSGYISWIVAGIDWTTANASTVEVANMSLGCECSSSSLDTAITNSVKAGVVYAVAAGNSDKDASTFSPANHPDVITVSALADFNGVSGGGAAPTCRSDQDDTLADFSNWGNKVEVAAPGVCILSTWPGGGTNTISGTSMASPHVAGAAALLASGANDPTNKTKVDAIRSTIVTKGNLNWIDDSGDGIKEPLLDVSDPVFAPATVAGSVGGGGGEPANSAPTASFTYGCTDLACSLDGSASTDSDGTISSYAWDFGDGATGSGVTASHTYASGGTYTVTLTVTDDDGATDAESRSVSVTDLSDPWGLVVTGTKVKGAKWAELTWSKGATLVLSVDVWRNGFRVVTTENDGSYTESLGKGGGSYTYTVCEAGGTSNCSNGVTVTF